MENKFYHFIIWKCAIAICLASIFWALLAHLSIKFPNKHPDLQDPISVNLIAFFPNGLLLYGCKF